MFLLRRHRRGENARVPIRRRRFSEKKVNDLVRCLAIGMFPKKLPALQFSMRRIFAFRDERDARIFFAYPFL